MSDKEFGNQLFLRILGERIAAQETALGQIAAAGGPGGAPEALKAARKVAHALKGSGALYGYPELSQAGGAAELASDADALRLGTDLLNLMKAIQAKARPDNALALIVDAPGAARDDLQHALSALGHGTAVAGTRAEAEKLIRENKILVIIMNVILSDADGRTFLRDMRDLPATASTPILVLLNAQFRALKNECWQLGANECFEGPFDWNTVAAKAGEAIARAKKSSPVEPGFAPPPPQVAKAIETPSVPAAVPSSAGRPAILLADDDELIGAIVSHRLSKEGFEVVHCVNGSDALEKIKSGSFDLLILDIQIPEVDGFSMLEQVRAMPSYRNVPIILLTALGKEQDIVRGFELGAADYIVKPFSPVEMLARVRRAMKKQ